MTWTENVSICFQYLLKILGASNKMRYYVSVRWSLIKINIQFDYELFGYSVHAPLIKFDVIWISGVVLLGGRGMRLTQVLSGNNPF